MKIYLIKVALRDVSPMVWRRLRVPSTSSLAMLHECIQIINRWDEFHLHQFHIYGKDYGINYDGGLSYADNAHVVYIDDFDFEIGDKFTYEYNFFKHIMHDIRIENITDSLPTKNSISCVSGSGRPGATKYDVAHVEIEMLKKLVKKKGKFLTRIFKSSKTTSTALNSTKIHKYRPHSTSQCIIYTKIIPFFYAFCGGV